VRSRLWGITELSFQQEQIAHYETLFTIGNGYLGTRGTFEEGYPGDSPATLVHGIYDHAPNTLVPELVNAPNWLELNIHIDGTPFQLITSADDILHPPNGVVLGYERTLHLDRGLLRREVLFRAASGSVVRLVFERFASLAADHILAQRVEIVAVDGNPVIEIESALDGDVSNNGVRHWKPDMTVTTDGDLIGLEATTAQSGYTLGMASRLVTSAPIRSQASANRPTSSMNIRLQQEESAVVYKFTSIYTNRDVAISPMAAARSKVHEATAAGYDKLLAAHEAEWAKYWETADIQIEGDEEIQRAIRFTTYHVLIPSPRHDDQVSVGAKTLSGLGYKGHVFWDTEIFLVPVLVLSQPQLARNLLMYRYHKLPGARHKAAANGYEGAMYPWESTDTGEETTPQWSDPQPDGTRIRIWTGDSEQHISTDIAYAIWNYWRWTGDDAFMFRYGAEIVLDTAVFWGSRVEHRDGRYEISRQIGPDEYHENIDNSVFVNRMVVWHLQTALRLLAHLRNIAPADAERLVTALDLTPQRLAHWADIIAHMFIPFDEQQQIHIEFPGFFDMEYIPVPHYSPRTTSVQAILGHPRTIQSQVIKQADVVLLMALLGDEVGSPEVQMNNWNTYFPRTDHGSSLSPATHAWVAARLGLDETAYEMLHHAAHIDLQDNKGNVRDGIHAAACGGVWQAIIFGFCGLHIAENDDLATAPRLPEHWRKVSFSVYYRGQKRDFTVTNPVSVALSS
jgi:trehalose/maltose hydrolase-like predicted phosphorylase